MCDTHPKINGEYYEGEYYSKEEAERRRRKQQAKEQAQQQQQQEEGAQEAETQQQRQQRQQREQLEQQQKAERAEAAEKAIKVCMPTAHSPSSHDTQAPPPTDTPPLTQACKKGCAAIPQIADGKDGSHKWTDENSAVKLKPDRTPVPAVTERDLNPRAPRPVCDTESSCRCRSRETSATRTASVPSSRIATRRD